MAGPYVYANPTSLVDSTKWVNDGYGGYYKQCVSLLKYYVPQLKGTSTSTWIKGVNVIETLNNGGSIAEGTAIATFLKGKNTFTSGHGHAAFFVSARKVKFKKDVWEEVEVNGKKKKVKKEVELEEYRITIVEQYDGSPGIYMRELQNYGKTDGEYNDYSNNGEAFCVIL
jgi:hypothetical protein